MKKLKISAILCIIALIAGMAIPTTMANNTTSVRLEAESMLESNQAFGSDDGSIRVGVFSGEGANPWATYKLSVAKTGVYEVYINSYSPNQETITGTITVNGKEIQRNSFLSNQNSYVEAKFGNFVLTEGENTFKYKNNFWGQMRVDYFEVRLVSELDKSNIIQEAEYPFDTNIVEFDTVGADSVLKASGAGANPYAVYNIYVPVDGVYSFSLKTCCVSQAEITSRITVDDREVYQKSHITSTDRNSLVESELVKLSLTKGYHTFKYQNLFWGSVFLDKLKLSYVEPIDYNNIKLECEFVNSGGEGVGFHDTSGNNALETANAGSGTIVTFREKEWQKYDFNLQKGGVYKVILSNATDYGDCRILVNVNGIDKLNSVFIPSGSWGGYAEAELGEIAFEEGKNTIQLINNHWGAYNIDYLRLVRVRDLPTVDYSNFKVEAEDRVSSTNGAGGTLTEIAGATGKVLEILSGGTAIYQVTVPAQTEYDFYIASDYQDTEVDTISINGVSYSLSTSQNGYEESNLGKFTLNAGKNTIVLENTYWDTYHIDYLRFENKVKSIFLYQNEILPGNEITKLTNGNLVAKTIVQNTQKATVIGILKNGDNIVNIFVKTYDNLLDGSNELTLNIDNVDLTKADSLKVTVWDGFENLKPILEAKDF